MSFNNKNTACVTSEFVRRLIDWVVNLVVACYCRLSAVRTTM